MTQASKIAQTYIDVWNERSAAERKVMLSNTWTTDAHYQDPMTQVEGTKSINEMIEAAQLRFPDFRFTLNGAVKGYSNIVRFSWALGPTDKPAPIEGSDVLLLNDGKIHKVIGFLDKVPQ